MPISKNAKLLARLTKRAAAIGAVKEDHHRPVPKVGLFEWLPIPEPAALIELYNK